MRPRHLRRPPANRLTARAEAAFESKCANKRHDRSHCKSMVDTLEGYAAFHRRVFSPETPCAGRRVLVVRESFSDIVGVGHARQNMQRFLAIGMLLGRAVVFSPCRSRADEWQVKGHALFKSAFPYDCDEPHLSFAEHYVGYGGIDLGWSPERQLLMARCNHSETSLNLHDHALPPHPSATTKPGRGARLAGCRPGWKGCVSGWNVDSMTCDTRTNAGCPDLASIFAPRDEPRERRRKPPKGVETGRRAPPAGARIRAGGALRELTPELLARAPLLAVYNARRDAGFFAAAQWQLAVANGDASVAPPNGSTVGIARDAALRDTLTCPYSCWSHANFAPSRTLLGLIDRAASRLAEPARAPLVCAHARTMWVDDHRCFPNPRGCQPVEFRRLSFWDTKNSITHSSGPRWGNPRAAIDGRGVNGRGNEYSSTTGSDSPLWWQLELDEPLPVCRLAIGAPRHHRPSAAARRAARAEQPRSLLNLRVLVLSASKQVVWSSDLLNGTRAPPSSAHGELLDVSMAGAPAGKFVRIERVFDDKGAARRRPVLAMSIRVYTDEPLSWRSADAFVNRSENPFTAPSISRSGGVCKLLRWRGACPHTDAMTPENTMLPLFGGWSGFVRCAATSKRFRAGLLRATEAGANSSARLWRKAATVQEAMLRSGYGRLLGEAPRRPPSGEALPPIYFSTDAPALQQLALDTFGEQIVTVSGEPMPSWESRLTATQYAKAFADFEVLKLCDVIVGPVSSNYAKTAARESLVTRAYFQQDGMCAADLRRRGELPPWNYNIHTPILNLSSAELDELARAAEEHAEKGAAKAKGAAKPKAPKFTFDGAQIVSHATMEWVRIPSTRRFAATRGADPGMFDDCRRIV